jgi:hypothetical protein
VTYFFSVYLSTPAEITSIKIEITIMNKLSLSFDINDFMSITINRVIAVTAINIRKITGRRWVLK